MARLSFYYRSKKENSNISIRLIHKRIDYTLRTPYVSKRSYWFHKTTKNGKSIIRHRKVEELKGTAELKQHQNSLIRFKEKLEEELLNDINSNIPISKEWFKNAIAKSHTVIEGKDNINIEVQKSKSKIAKQEQVRIKNLLSEGVKSIYSKYKSNNKELKKFKVTSMWVELFQDYSIDKPKFRIIDFNQQFIDDFKYWAIDVMEYKLSTTIGHLKRIKRAINYAYFNDTKDEIKIHKQLQYLKFTNAKEQEMKNDKIVITLTYDELDKIDAYDFSSNKKEYETQKLILIGCETGLRFTDFNKLIDKYLKTSIDGIDYWEFKTNKTKKWVQIIKTDRLKAILKKYGEPKTEFYKNEDSEINRMMKQVCRKAKINQVVEGDLSVSVEINGKTTRRTKRGYYPKHKLITTRTLRRSFATNYYRKIDDELIMAVTGHTTKKMLQVYLDVHDDSNILNGYKKINKFHKERKEYKLNIV